MVFQRIKNMKNSDFIKSLSVLLTGTLIAQAIGYLIAPILTRLYTPSEIGELGFYLRLTGFLSAIATLRYELAIPLPKNHGHSYLLYRLSLMISIIILCFIFLILGGILFSGYSIGMELWYLIMVILGAAFTVIINLGTNWSVRMGSFSVISRQKIVNSFLSNGLKWFFALFSWSYFGLIFSTLIGLVVSSIEIIFNFKKIREKFKHFRSSRKTRFLMKKHIEFPLVNLPHVIIDNGRDMLVASLIFTHFSSSIYGSFSHSYNMLRIPMMLVGVSLSQLFYNQAVKKYNNNEPILPLFRKIIGFLTLLSIVPFTTLYFYGETIFSWVFGAPWALSGRYSETMSFWLLVNFILSPISSLPLIIGIQRLAFVFGIISALIQVIPLWLIPHFYGNSEPIFELSLQIISYSQAVWLLFCVVFYSIFVYKNDLRLKNE